MYKKRIKRLILILGLVSYSSISYGWVGTKESWVKIEKGFSNILPLYQKQCFSQIISRKATREEIKRYKDPLHWKAGVEEIMDRKMSYNDMFKRTPYYYYFCEKPKLIATNSEIKELRKDLNIFSREAFLSIIKIDKRMKNNNDDYRKRLIEKLSTLENDIVNSKIFKEKVAEEVERLLKVESAAIEERIMMKILKGK